MTEQNIMLPPQDRIKLEKNSRGYNWEISVSSHDIDLLEKLNNEMKKRFEVKNETENN